MANAFYTYHALSVILAVASAFASPTRRADKWTPKDIQEWLCSHNAERTKHDAPPLAWNATPATAAATWTDQCHWRHSNGIVGHYGENLFAGKGCTNITFVVDFWDREESDYNPQMPRASHWTQVVWKSTKQVGCSRTICAMPEIDSSGQKDVDYYACEYYPPGNVRERYNQNVQK